LPKLMTGPRTLHLGADDLDLPVIVVSDRPWTTQSTCAH